MSKATKIILKSLYYSGASTLLSPLLGGGGAILMLHRTNPDNQAAFAPNSGLTIKPKFLDHLLGQLKNAGFQFVSMDEIVDDLQSGELKKNGKKKLAVTLDDGYRDNLQYAVPVFSKHQVPYTIFIAPGLVDGRATLWWEDLERLIAKQNKVHIPLEKGPLGFDCRTTKEKNDAFVQIMDIMSSKVDETTQREIIKELDWLNKTENEAHRADSIMSWADIHELSQDPLCTIGAHTIHHYAVARLEAKEALYEMQESGNIIKSELGEFPRHFAYPYGFPAAAGARDFELAIKAGYSCAVTTRHGVLFGEHKNHLTALPRISVNGGFQTAGETKALLGGIPTRLANRGRKLNVA